MQQRSERAKHVNECLCHLEPLYLMEKESADQDGNPDVPPPTLNEPQCQHLLKQTAMMASVYDKLWERDRLELVSARAGADAAGRADLEAMMLATGGMDETRRSSSIDDIAHDTKGAPFCNNSRVTSRPIRGGREKGWMFNKEDLLERFMTFLKAKEGVTVQVAHSFVNNILLGRDLCGVSMLDFAPYLVWTPIFSARKHRVLVHEQAGCVYPRVRRRSPPTASRGSCSTGTRLHRKFVAHEHAFCHSGYIDVTALADAQILLRDGTNEWELYEFQVGANNFVEFRVDRLGQTETVDSDFYSAIREKLGGEGLLQCALAERFDSTWIPFER